MSYISQTEAERILKPYYDFFVEIYLKAIEDWKKVSSIFPTLDTRTRACFINSRVKEYTREKFPSENIFEKRGKFLLCLENIAGRYKKLKNSLPSNIFTQEALKLECQQLVLGDEFAPPTFVNIGYSPNKAYTDFRFEISCVKGKEILWQLDLPSPIISAELIEISQNDIPEPPKQKKRVHKKAK